MAELSLPAALLPTNTSGTSTNSPHPPPITRPPPAIAALFVVVFDHRKGYVLRWHKSLRNVQVEGVVEFKSLPSGLHRVDEDLIYFVHGNYAGVSAYVNRPDATAERHATMLAVGVLVPLEHDRMGKSWRHAEPLKVLAREQIKDRDDSATKSLDAYWQEHRIVGDDVDGANVDWGAMRTSTPWPDASVDSVAEPHDAEPDRPNGYQANRSMSVMSVFVPDGATHLSPHHPAATLPEMVSEFGPLIFPLYRAALLRKRILLVTEAPVEFACNIVYNLSVLSSLQRSLLAYLPAGPCASIRRIPALFNIGITDIDDLSQHPFPDGWIACTTDDVLVTKPQLYDIAVHLPSRDSSHAAHKKIYPKIVLSSGEDVAKHQLPQTRVRASQRDASESSAVDDGGLAEQSVDADAASTLSSNAPSLQEQQDLVEPPSWARVAYTSLLWWATAGDRRNGLTADEEEEMERDALLFDSRDDGEDQTKEVVIVGYFRRLTAIMFQAVHESKDNRREDNAIVSANYHPFEHHHQPSFDKGDQQRPLLPKNASEPYHDDAEDDDDTLVFTPEDLSAMGLDAWSRNDCDFVEELLRVWWNRKARVRSGHVECCGLRIL
ncbi:hypothetical protein DV736_g2579, partial [Chaetothyriales sp. CBS 134916]